MPARGRRDRGEAAPNGAASRVLLGVGYVLVAIATLRGSSAFSFGACTMSTPFVNSAPML